MKKENFSISLIAAMSQEKVVASQFIEGGVDSSVFASFIDELLLSIKSNPALQGKQVVLLMDNARIHHHSLVLETARKDGVMVLFSAEYSPWLNPIESLFAFLKHSVRS